MAELPPALMNEGQRVFTDNFRNESWEGKRWQSRKSSKSTRPILIGRTRKLINSVRTSGRSASMQRIVWASYVPYAKIHNEGFNGSITVKAHKRKAPKNKLAQLGAKYQVKQYTKRVIMPKRQFMGVGNTLRMRLIKKAEQIFRA